MAPPEAQLTLTVCLFLTQSAKQRHFNTWEANSPAKGLSTSILKSTDPGSESQEQDHRITVMEWFGLQGT